MIEIAIPNGKIRELQESDLEKFIEMSKDKDIQELFFLDKDIELEEFWQKTLEFQRIMRKIDKRQRDYFCLSVEHENQLKGYFSISNIVLTNPNSPVYFIGFFIGKTYQNKGIGKSVLDSSIDFLFNTLDQNCIYASVTENNFSCQRLLERSGMKKIHSYEKHNKPIFLYGLRKTPNAPIPEIPIDLSIESII
jgi:RimJ/RimL family protein N-acetyltransferase